MREILQGRKQQYLMIDGMIVKPSQGYEFVIFERPLPQDKLSDEQIRKLGRPSRDGKPV